MSERLREAGNKYVFTAESWRDFCNTNYSYAMCPPFVVHNDITYVDAINPMGDSIKIPIKPFKKWLGVQG